MVLRIAMGIGLLAPLAAANAAAEPAGPPICTDRPSKANGTCTVPAGRVQLEAGTIGWSLTKADGVRTEVLTAGSSFAKIGLSDRSDLQVGVTPYARLTVEQDGMRDGTSGFGDIVVRYKHRLTRDDAPVAVGIIPFVKLPTAEDGLGNGRVEGGLAVPISLAAGGATVTFGPELDLLADSDGSGRHAALVNLVNVAFPAAPRLTLAAELWSNLNFDPAGTSTQASADASVAYLISNEVQVDAGVNLGLTRDTPDLELYAGASIRF